MSDDSLFKIRSEPDVESIFVLAKKDINNKFHGVESLLLNSADSGMVSRLTQRIMKVIQADAVSERGLRNVIDGEAELLA